jgi:hypothetical protein
MGARRKKSEKRQRNAHIMVRVTEEEKEQIRFKATMTGYPRRTGTYMRKAALNLPLRSVVDEAAVDALLQSRADLNRLGGLLKLWITKNADDPTLTLGKRTFADVDELLSTIEAQGQTLLEYAKRLMKSKKA